jgi:GntR family transcriptional regulator
MTEQLLRYLRLNPISRRNGPYYIQIREILREYITSGQVEVGEQLPPETQLAEVFGVSRMTVRRALSELADDGMLRRMHGLGTVVASRRVVRDYNRLLSFYEDAQRVGLSPSSHLQAREVVPAPPHIAEGLMLTSGAPTIHLTRLRYTEKQITAINEVYVSQALCPWLLDEDLENQSLYYLYELHGHELEWGHQCIEARAATPEQADLLEVEPGHPILYLQRTTYAVNNLPIEWVESFSPAGSYTLRMTLKR